MAERPKLCGNCGKLIGLERTCPYCGVDNKSLSVRLKRAANQAKGQSSVVLVICGINVFLYLVMLAVGGIAEGGGALSFLSPTDETIIRFGGLLPGAIGAGDWWRLITPIFLHGGILHVGFNTFIFYYVGRHMEAEFGGRLTLLVYMLSGILAAVGTFLTLSPSGIGLGASGAVSGILGAMLVRRWLVDGNLRNPLTIYIIQLVVLTAVLGAIMPGVDNVAHLVGFLAGAGISALLTKVKISRRGALGIMLMTSLVTVVTAVGLVMMVIAVMTQGSRTDVRHAVSCAQGVERALVDRGRAVDVQKAGHAIDCLDKAVALPGDAGRGMALMRSGLETASDAHEGGNIADEQEGVQRARQGVTVFAKWWSQNRSRYGM